MPEKIIIDTDPGQDDAVAILTALASPEELDVLGIVAVAGNVGLAKNANNALKIVELSGRTEVPVYAGCPGPMMHPLVTAEHVHGESGLNGPELPEPKISLQSQHGVDYIIDTLMAHAPGTISLCTLGPLTNIAMALLKQPAIAPRIKQIVAMGGAYFQVGNITPAAEFNFYVDPEAADIVMRCGAPITIASLDVTHKVLSTHERIKRFQDLGNNTGISVAAMLDFSERFDMEKYKWQGAPLHDPCVIAYMLQPDMFKGRTINVTIETNSPLTRGMSVADFWGVTDEKQFPRNANFLSDVDDQAYYDLLTERLARLP